MENITESVKRIVKEACCNKPGIGDDLWFHHVKPVVEYSKRLADILRADVEIVELAALLHDYAKIANKCNNEIHHIVGMEEAQKILSIYNYPEEKIELVKKCIYSHRGDVQIERTTVEEKCLASADALAHIDHALWIMACAYKKHDGKFKNTLAWMNEKLERSWNKLCPEAKDIIKEKFDLLKEIISSKMVFSK